MVGLKASDFGFILLFDELMLALEVEQGAFN